MDKISFEADGLDYFFIVLNDKGVVGDIIHTGHDNYSVYWQGDNCPAAFHGLESAKAYARDRLRGRTLI